MQSMSRVGCCIDNGPLEGFLRSLQSKMCYLKEFCTDHEFQEALIKCMHTYNYERKQKRLDIHAPISYCAMLGRQQEKSSIDFDGTQQFFSYLHCLLDLELFSGRFFLFLVAWNRSRCTGE